MKPFRFTLEAVRTVRQRQERVALESYTRALLSHERICERLRQAQGRLREAWSQLQEQWRESTHASAVAQSSAYCQRLEEERQQCESALRASQETLNQMLQQWLAARQKLEAIEKAFEQQRRRHDRSEQAASQKELDELANRGEPWTGFPDFDSLNCWN